MTANEYLYSILNKYQPNSFEIYSSELDLLYDRIKKRAFECFIDVLFSWSCAKGTAIRLSSDVDFLVSLVHNCDENNWWLKGIYTSLYDTLKINYSNIRKQNVSIRVNTGNLEVDITPARKHLWNTNDHSIYLSKKDTRRQTNIQKHINDISNSGRTNEIKLLKIWRELNRLEFPSIYMEYLVIEILSGRSKNRDALENNFRYLLSELAKDTWNPLNYSIIDPANTNNVLSDLMDDQEKRSIIRQAKIDSNHSALSSVFKTSPPFPVSL